ncbi:MAG: LamG-like jellyroll fold domain-containing protein, partial [Verrucomicrobiota bacterium]
MLTAEEQNTIGFYLAEKYGVGTSYRDPVAPAYTADGSVWSEGFEVVYHMEESVGNATDSSPGMVTAVNDGMDYVGGGVINGAAMADQAGDDFLIANFTPTSFTAEVWYYYDRTDEGGWNTLFVRNGGTYHHLLINDGSRQVGFFNGPGGGFFSSGVALNLGEWHHLVAMAHGTDYELYHNGTLIMSNPNFFINSSATPLNRISTYNGANQTAFGLLDEVRLSGRTRSADWVWATWMNTASNDQFACYMPLVTNQVVDLVLTKTVSSTNLLIGSNLTYTIAVTNLGPSIALGVVVTDTLPVEVDYLSSTPPAA